MILLNTSHSNLPDFFKTISIDEIEECFDSKVYFRGMEYHEEGLVQEVSISPNKHQLYCTVIGNDDYKVIISLQRNEVSATCTCPFDGPCKHIAAALLYAMDEVNDIRISLAPNEMLFDKDRYLHNLPKNELVNLVKKFAPENFWMEVKNSFKDSPTAKNIFAKVESKIKKIFEDDTKMYDPFDFGTELNKEIKKLRGLEKQLFPEAGQLMQYIIQQVDEAICDGYLYDHYNDDQYEPSDEFIAFYESYAQSLDLEEKIQFLANLEMALKDNSYSTFDDLLHHLHKTVLTDEDFKLLKEKIATDSKKFSHLIIERCYESMAQMLSEKEKEIMLHELQIHDDKWAIELAQLYDSQGQTMKAIETIKNRLANNKHWDMEAIYTYYLDLLSKAGTDLVEEAKEAIFHCSSCTMLQKVASLVNGETKEYELILEKKNEGQLLNYLESNNRLEEALELIKRSKQMWGSQVFDFYKKHKKVFPSDAEEFFCNEISKNIEYTGDSYYHAVANSIKQLKQINNQLAQQYLRDIQSNYKRRRNLMVILSKI